MKVCSNCGARENDATIFCSQCKEKLVDPISEDEKELIEKETKKTLEKSYKKSNSILSKTIFLLSLLPYVFIILNALHSALFGVDKFYSRIYSGPITIIYGMEAFLQSLFWMTIFFIESIPIIPFCLIYQIIYYFIIKYGGEKTT